MSTIEHHSDSEHSAESHALPPELVAHQQRRSMILFIVADAVFFACLLLTYFYLRSLNVDGMWLGPEAKTADALLIWVIIGVTVLSAVAYRSGEMGIRANSRSRFQTGTLVAILLVVAAIGLTIYQMKTWPILMSDGSYASTFILMTGTQLVHLFILLFVGIGIWNRGNKGKFDGGKYNHVTVVGYFWYWLALVALLGGLTSLVV
jgi:heme/copper-type cytochrome/quinol oxidase subunit 3